MLFPMFMNLDGRKAIVVGDGVAAARKAMWLLRAGARITVIAPSPHPELATLCRDQRVTLVERAFQPADVAGASVVITANERLDDDIAVVRAATDAHIPVNAVDRPDLSTFIMPAIVDRDPLIVAISSAGTAPVLSRTVRARIEALLPRNMGRLARFAHDFRGAVTAAGAWPSKRRFWEHFFRGPVAAHVLAGDEAKAREGMLALVNRRVPEEPGLVQIVGAGPGDPDLLTLKALQALQEADVVVHDRLITADILDYARRDARRIDVGKTRGHHTTSQDAINDVLITQARAGHRVVRLKGGDPFVFGRGGEELDALTRAGVRVEVVPGITAALGCAAALGLPLTHRDHAQAITVVTGEGRRGDPDLDWTALARRNQTIVVYMGGERAERIAVKLIAAGINPSTPAAAIARGTRADQQVAMGAVAELGTLVARVGATPVLLVIGDVVRHAAQWTAASEPQAVAAQAVAV
jgi:uroporphyrin-III C-methyltransferase / precorrin-2 dehydrogenase / sirohydrochlorin ferrochelatase